MNGKPANEEQLINNLMVVMTIYGRKVEESEAFQSLTAALFGHHSSATIFIYDNSSEPQDIKPSPHWKIHYQHDPKNSGVSKAYNEGYTKASEQNKSWILLADQDTLFPPDTFTKYFESIDQNSAEVYVPILKDARGPISPHVFRWGAGYRVKTINALTKLPLDSYFFVNSGLLISTGAFGKTGYDENLPLDFSDFAFVHRLKKNYSCFYLVDLCCHHHLSSTEKILHPKKLERFRNYLMASKYYNANYSLNNRWIPIRNLLRAVKLSTRHESLQFVMLYLRTI